MKDTIYYIQYFRETDAGFERVHIEKQTTDRLAALLRMAEIELRPDVYRANLLTNESRAVKIIRRTFKSIHHSADTIDTEHQPY